MRKIDLTNMKFGRLTVISEDVEKNAENSIRKKNGQIKGYSSHWMCMCECGKIASISMSNLKSGNTISCGCYSSEELTIRNSLNFTVSFKQWCIDNSCRDYLELWDYTLNDKSPEEIGYSSSLDIYFKCPNGIHNSELWNINHVSGKNTNISCRKCNSVGGFLVDMYGEDAIQKYWSDKNKFDAFDVNKGSDRYIWIKCQECGIDNRIIASNFVNRAISCYNCGITSSYPNRMISNVLSQLNIDYIPEYSPKWANKKRYDFYIDYNKTIIEVNGLQHYKEAGRGRSLEEEQENDKNKMNEAFINGVLNYIVLNCSRSSLEYIRCSINNSEMKSVFGFCDNDINWKKCHINSCDSDVRLTCETWIKCKNNSSMTARELNMSRQMVTSRLKKGAILGFCDYNPEYEKHKKGNYENRNKYSIEVFKDGVFIGKYKSARYLSEKSYDIFGIKLTINGIARVARGDRFQYKGYRFFYAS